ncbi:MAG TPA: ROK family protein, partial [Chloroflexi bacterium]|nr:ROK family protein [Chloroflexota bacterium]
MLLGIDTGGTYTDAVLIGEDGEIVAESKALTTPHNLAEGIEEALASLPGELLAQVRLVGLSTTLATNAIVEGKGAPVCLILIGYDRELIERYDFWSELVTPDVVFIRGGHTLEGREKEPLDLEAARKAVLERRDKVGAFAISGYFGVRNPAHELQVKELVQELTGLPSTCGHELTAQLDSIRRATTVALNARLIPILQE